MKAIIENKITYKITGEKGDFFITENNKGKLKMFAKRNVTIVELAEMPKAKAYKSIEVSAKVANYNAIQHTSNVQVAEYFEKNF